MATALRTGTNPFTGRESEVLGAAAEEHTSEQMVQRMHLTSVTVRNYSRAS